MSVVVSVCSYVTGGYVCGVQFFGGLCGGPSICLGDGIVLEFVVLGVGALLVCV